MSGGSYSYLCYKDADQILEHLSEIEDMRDRLAGLGYAEDAAQETAELILIINQCFDRIDEITVRLAAVWKAVEWWDSGDSGEDDLKKALVEYGGKKGENDQG